MRTRRQLRQKDIQLLEAVAEGSFENIIASIKKWPDPNVRDKNNIPVLHLIIKSPKLNFWSKHVRSSNYSLKTVHVYMIWIMIKKML